MENYLYTGFLTLISGFISSYITIKFGLHKDLIVTRRERIEKYAMSLISIDVMLEKYKQKYLFSYDDVEIDEIGLGTVEMLTKLYFTKVQKEFNSFNMSVAKYKQNLFATKSQLLITQQASQYPTVKAIPTQQMIDESSELTMKAYEERNALLVSLIKAYPLLEDKNLVSKGIHKLKTWCA
jgi:hypothetical protein